MTRPPRPAARSSHRRRIGANGSAEAASRRAAARPRSARRTQRRGGRRALRGVTAGPRSLEARSPDRACPRAPTATLTPKPMTTANAPSGPIRGLRAAGPATLAPSSRRSFGHFSASRGAAEAGRRLRRPRAARGRRRSRAAARAAGSQGSIRRRLAWRLPGGEAQARPCRPLPCMLLAGDDPEPARIAGAARRASASSFVDAGRVRATTKPEAGGSDCRRREACTSEQRRAAAPAAPTSGRRNEPEQEHDGARQRRARACRPSRHRLEGAPRLVEVHHLDDAEVVDRRRPRSSRRRSPRASRGWPGSRRRRRRTWRRSRRAAGCRRARTSSSARQKAMHRMGARRGRRDRRSFSNMHAAAAHRQDAGEGAERHGEVDRHVDRRRPGRPRRCRRRARSARSRHCRWRNRPSGA